MNGLCKDCGRLLFPRYGDGDTICAGCRENQQEPNLPPAIEPKPGEPGGGAAIIGGKRYTLMPAQDVCLAHLQPEPCAACAAYKAAGL